MNSYTFNPSVPKRGLLQCCISLITNYNCFVLVWNLAFQTAVRQELECMALKVQKGKQM